MASLQGCTSDTLLKSRGFALSDVSSHYADPCLGCLILINKIFLVVMLLSSFCSNQQLPHLLKMLPFFFMRTAKASMVVSSALVVVLAMTITTASPQSLRTHKHNRHEKYEAIPQDGPTMKTNKKGDDVLIMKEEGLLEYGPLAGEAMPFAHAALEHQQPSWMTIAKEEMNGLDGGKIMLPEGAISGEGKGGKSMTADATSTTTSSSPSNQAQGGGDGGDIGMTGLIRQPRAFIGPLDQRPPISTHSDEEASKVVGDITKSLDGGDDADKPSSTTADAVEEGQETVVAPGGVFVGGGDKRITRYDHPPAGAMFGTNFFDGILQETETEIDMDGQSSSSSSSGGGGTIDTYDEGAAAAYNP